MSSNKKNKNSFLMNIFDTLFIMILCFATLLTTMLMQGGVEVGNYTFNLFTFAMVVAGLLVYLWYIIPHSDRELRSTIVNIYETKNSK